MTTACVVKAQRLQALGGYVFAEIGRRIAAKRAEGIDVISLAVGDPVEPTPSHIVEAMAAAIGKPENHQYPAYNGSPGFRRAVASYYRRRFGVGLDPEAEIVALIGSKEGNIHLGLALLDPGDAALVPQPGYPPYTTGAVFAGAEPFIMPLTSDNDFLPDLDAIPETVARRAKLMFLNYPNMPTGAVADRDFFRRAVDFAREHGIVVCHDNPYVDIAYDGYRPPSILEVPGARDVAVEFGSCSKPYNMTGWRIGWAVGNPGLVGAIAQSKENTDSGVFTAVQEAAVAALTGPQDCLEQQGALYQRRRDLVCDTLQACGLEVRRPRATLYIWVPVPGGESSLDFAGRLLEEAAIVVIPGRSYGEAGEGYVRISLTVPDDRLSEAMDRLRQVLGR